ncbi:DUF4345 domain-containing protein [Aureivirga sp. CE67]|uniref:DUF4345 domain-containing protein n=1 Tax=Aureivirga sp. CE67 TaxID=1788983 RepID=UPI0018C9E15F|nr:DUF4345 domain-containing protein [Aureivirga sp. CE67]
MEIFKIITLSLSGILLTFVGLSRLVNPLKTYYKNSGISLHKDTNLLNEIRGLSAVMFLSGLLILLGIFLPKFTFTSFIIAILIFIGFAIGRVFSMNSDGKPNKQIMQGIFSEIILGGLNISYLILAMI